MPKKREPIPDGFKFINKHEENLYYKQRTSISKILKIRNKEICYLCHVVSPISGELYCQKCKDRKNNWSKNNRDKVRKIEQRYCLKYPEKYKEKLLRKNLKINYGISIEEYNKIFDHQFGVCAICAKPPNGNRLHVDHDHKTGTIRGLLCVHCNHAIGKFNEDIKTMYSAIAYLRNHAETGNKVAA